MALILTCALCFVCGFFFSLGLKFPFLEAHLENIYLFFGFLLLPFAILFFFFMLIKTFARIHEISMRLLLLAMGGPIISYIGVCIFYGAAHF